MKLAKVIRFYGLSYKETVSMGAQDFMMLWLAISPLEAQEHMSQLRVIDFPHLKKGAREERNKKLQAAAYPRDLYPREAKDASFLVQKLGGASGGR